jgi:hypothetical protein
MNVAATSTAATNAAVQEFAKVSLRAIAQPYLRRHFKATSAPWRKREILRIGSVKWL